MAANNRMKWLYAALLAGTLTLMGPPSPAVDDSVNDDNLFELGQNEDTLEDHDTTFGSGPHKDQRDPRANMLGCTDADETGTIATDCTDPADTFSLKVTPGRGPDWADLFTGELNTDVDPTDIDRAFVVPTLTDEVSGTPGNITPGPDGIPDFKNYGGIFATFVGDQISAGSLEDDTTTVSGGSDTNNDLPTTYEWNTGSVPIKDDITNLGCYARNNPNNNHLVIYCGVERLNTDGDSHLDLEINQSPVGLDEEPPCDKAHCFFTGVRTTNDVLISIDFLNGGDLGSLDVRKWTTTTAPNGTWGTGPVVELTGEGCNPAFNGTAADSVCIFNNNANINGGPWPNFVKSSTPVANDTFANGYTGGVIPRNALSEFGIDVTALLGVTPCFSTALVKSRSSGSFTAQLKDFAATGFALCKIAVTKTGDSISKVGDAVNYSITIENTGGITLYKDDISDTLLGSITSNGVNQANAFVTNNTCGASLASGASCTISLTRTVQAGDPDPLPNTVTVTYNNNSNLTGASVTQTDDHSVNLFQPAVTVDKTADKTLAVVGENVKYTFTITNTSSSDAPHLIVDSINDTVLGDLSGPAPASCDDLAFGASCTFDVTRAVQAGDPDPLVNTVTVHYHPLNFPNDIHASDSHSVNLFTTGVVVTKGGDTLSKIGDSAHFTFHIANTGSADSPNLVLDSVSDDVLGTLTAAATTAGCGTLAPGASCDFSADRVTQAGDPDPLVNTVTVHFHPTGLATDVADTDSHSTNLFQPSVQIVKGGETTAQVGDTIHYTFAITNNSSADTPNLVLASVTDTLLGNLTADATTAGCTTLAPAASCNFTKDRVVLQGDPNPLPNTVTALYHPTGFPNNVQDTDDHSVNLFSTSVQVVKTGDTLSKVGDDVTYHFVITNTGSANSPDLQLVSISDTLLGDLSGPAPASCDTLAAGASCNFDVTRTVLAGDPDPLPNTVTVTYDPVGPATAVSDTDDHSVNLFQPGVNVTKTGDTLSKVGDAVNYTITVTNTSSNDSPNLVNGTIVDTLLGNLLSGANPFVTNSTCSATLPTGGSCTITATRTVLAGDADPLPNTVTVHYNPDGFPNDITDSDDHTVQLFQPNVTIDKTGDTLSKVTDSVNYTITVNNTSSADTPNLSCTITDALLGINKQVNLASGAQDVTNASRVVQVGDPDPLPNTASVTCTVDGFDNVIGPKTDDHSVNLFQPSVDVTKVCNEPDSTVVAGDVADFLITITNTSSADSPNLALDSFTDSLGTSAAAGCSTLAPGGSCQFPASKLTTIADIGIGVDNTATAHYHPVGFPNDISDSGSAHCNVVRPGPGEIHIEKVTLGSTGTFNYTTTGGDGLSDFGLTTVVGASTVGSPFGPVPTPASDGFATTGPIPVDTTFNTFTTYTVDEVVPAGFEFVSLQCTEDGVQDSTPLVVDTASHLATLKVEPGETLYCRYVNKPVQVGQGCTPGYWRNHATRWDGSSGATINNSGPVNCGGSNANDFTTDVKTCRGFNATFGVTSAQSGLLNSVTLLGATNSPGGGATGLRQLAFHAAAALASADAGQVPNDVLDYPYTIQQVIDIYRSGVLPGGLTVNEAKNELAAANNLGCPLN